MSNAALPAQFFHRQDELRGAIDPALCDPSYRIDLPGFPEMDVEAHSEFGRQFYVAFPDLRHEVTKVLADSGQLAVAFTMRGTQSGAFFGIPASGRPVEVSAMAFFTLENGRVARIRGVFDQLGLLRQIGAVPA